MNLQFIRTSACPVCGCSLVRCERVEVENNKIREHTNGGHWETREFACGYITEYIPNYMSEAMKKNCPNNPAIIAEKQRKNDLINKLIKTIQESNCDENYKMNLLSSFSWRI